MKKAVKSLLSCILAAFVVVFLIFSCIFLLPVDLIKYKRSFFYKNTKEKYKPFAASGVNFKLYNDIVKSRLPIEFLFDPQDRSVECGRFVFKNVLIIPSAFSFELDPESGNWNYCCEDENGKRVLITLDEYISTEIEEVNCIIGKKVCDDAVVLIDADSIEPEGSAMSEPKFLIYSNDRTEKLKKFCAEQY